MAPVEKNPPANAGDISDVGWIPGSGICPGGGHGNPLNYSCLENPMDKGSWQATVHRVTKSQTLLKQLSTYKVIDFFSWSSKVSVSSWVIPQRLGRIPVLPSYHKFWTQIYPPPPITWAGSHSRISWNNYECQSLIDLVLIPLPSLLGLHTLPTHNLRFLSHN